MINKMITAEECFNNFVDFEIYPLKEYTPKILTNDTKLAMIKFAKLHVEAALKAADIAGSDFNSGGAIYEEYQEAVLNAYPLENIK